MVESDILPRAGFEVRSDFREQKWLSVAGLAVLTAACGGVGALIDETTPAGKVVTGFGALLVLSLAYVWLYYDSIEHHYPIGILLGICIILLAGIGIPIYFFRTRGLRGFISLGLTLLFGCGLGLIWYTSGYAVDYVWRTFAH